MTLLHMFSDTFSMNASQSVNGGSSRVHWATGSPRPERPKMMTSTSLPLPSYHSSLTHCSLSTQDKITHILFTRKKLCSNSMCFEHALISFKIKDENVADIFLASFKYHFPTTFHMTFSHSTWWWIIKFKNHIFPPSTKLYNAMVHASSIYALISACVKNEIQTISLFLFEFTLEPNHLFTLDS